MKKTTVILLLALLSVDLFCEIGKPLIKIQSLTGYYMELLQLEIIIPEATHKSKLEVELKALEGEARELNRTLSHTYSYNVDEDSSKVFSACKVEFVPFSTGSLSLQAIVRDLENPGDPLTSEILVLQVLPLPEGLEKDRALIHPYTIKNQYFTGEKIELSYELFYGDMFDEISMTFPLLEGFDVQFLDQKEDRLVFVDSVPVHVVSFPTALFAAEKPGLLTIPRQSLYLPYSEGGGGVVLDSDNLEIHIAQVPLNENLSNTESYVIGADFEVIADDLPETLKYGESYAFQISLKGNANLDSIKSLQSFSNFPDKIEEVETFFIQRLIDDELVSIKRFNYRGTSHSLIGYRMKSLNIPFFNTDEGLWQESITEIPEINGNLSYWQSIIFSLLILTIFIGVVLFVILYKRKMFKRPSVKKKGVADLSQLEQQVRIQKFAELYKLTAREREILSILSEGLATKEIAEKLFISPETLKKHIRNIMKKTETHSRFEIYVLYSKFISKNS